MKKIPTLLIISIVILLNSCTAVVNMNFLVEKQLPGLVLTVAGYDVGTERLTVSAALPADKIDVESDFEYNWLVNDTPVELAGGTLTYQTNGDQITYSVVCYLSKPGRDDSIPTEIDINLIALVPQLRLWLDGADASSFTYDADKKISRWADKSAFSNDADQSEAGNSPRFVDQIQNDHSIVRFDGVDDYFPDVFTIPTTNMTIFTVFSHKHSTAETAKGPLWQTDAYANVSGFYPYYETRQRLAKSNTEWLEGSSRFRTETWYLAEVVYGTNSVALSRNGEEDISDGTNTITNGGFQVAKSTLGDYFRGDIGEILFFNGALTGSLTAKIYNYLMGKWGITASQDNPEPEIALLQQGTEYFTAQSYDMAAVSSTSLETVFTIENTGTADLTVTQISISGSGFLLDQAYSGITVPAGTTTDFTVVFTPLSEGAYSGTVTIECNDFDESEFVLNLDGTATPYPEPEILLRRGANDIASGESYDFASLVQSSGTKTVTFIILNIGTAELTINSISVDDTVNYTVDSSATLSPLPMGISTTFDVTFAPLSTGVFDATLTVSNDDEDEGNYIVALSGQGTESPEPEITAKSIDGLILFPSGGSGHEFDDQLSESSSNPFTFIIHNDGTTPLLISTITIDDSTNFNLINSIDGVSISAGNYAGFSVAFTPQSVGSHTASVTIANNDTDESSYIINLAGEGIEPDVSLWKGLTEYTSSGAPYSFGDVLITAADVEITFDVRNSGGAPLSVFSMSVSDNTNYTLNWPYVTVQEIAPGASLPFTISFHPTSAGTKDGAVYVYNDSTTSTFALNIAGTGTEIAVPEIAVFQDTDEFISGSTSYDFGSLVQATTSSNVPFTINNTGTADLTISSITVGDPANFFLDTASATSPVVPGGSTDFTIAFSPGSTGTYNSIITISNNDSNEGAFVINISGAGTATPVPEIELSEDGAEYPSDGPAYNFGSIVEATAGDPVLFTISNTGTADLTVTSVTLDDAVNFSLDDASTAGTVAAGGNTTFTVTFTPNSTGSFATTVTIANNDGNESSYVLNLAGTGTNTPVPDITIKSGLTEYPDGGASYDFGSLVENDISPPTTFTIFNDGSANLTITSVVLDDTTNYTLGSSLDGVVLSPSSSGNFNVTFNPVSTGVFDTFVTLDTDDPDEDPYILNVTGQGTATPQPEITVLSDYGSVDYTSDVTVYDFGDVLVDPATPPESSFEIKNTGTADLSITGIVLDDTTNYSFSDGTTTATLVPGQIMDKAVTFTPQSVGIKNAELSFFSSDSDENPFILKITGNGVIPDLTIAENGKEYFHNDTACDFGITDNFIKTFTVTNPGTGPLEIYSINSTNNTVFNLDTGGTLFTLPAAQTTTFAVEYDNSGDTSRMSEKINIVSSWPEGDFEINVFAGGETIDFALSPDDGYRLDGHGFDFGYQTTAANQDLSFTNNEVFDVEIVSSTILSDDFIAPDMGSVTILVDNTEILNVEYDPTVTADTSQIINLVLADEMGRVYTAVLRGANLEPPDHSTLATDLALWLDAERIAADNTTTEGPNIFVHTFPDVSGRSENLDAVSASIPTDRRPLFIEEGINSHPVLRFNGSDDYMLIDPDTDQYIYYGEDETTVFVVFTQGITNNRYLMAGAVAPVNYATWPRCYLDNSGGGRFRVYGYNDWYTSVSGTWTTSTSYLWTMEKDLAAGDMLRVWINSVEPAEASDNVAYDLGGNKYRNQRLDKLVIGANYNFLTFFQGDLAEIIVYRRKLTGEETGWVNDYLNDKYNLW